MASDHAGYQLKVLLKDYLVERDIEVIDFGSYDTESADYPDTGFLAAQDVAEGKSDIGILVCATGHGMNMVANKVKGIRACLCLNKESAKFSRQHNDANVLVLSSKQTMSTEIFQIVDVFLNESFSNEERHLRRLNKIKDYENKK